MESKKNYIKLIFGLKIKQLRQEKQLSLNELAEKSSLSVSYLNEIERGKKYPKAEKIIQLANALGVSYDSLVSLKLSKNLTPIQELIDSNILEMLPLDHYGIDINKFISLMSDASYQLSALVATVIDLAKSSEMSQNNFSRTALRIYKEINENHFNELEITVDNFIKEFNLNDSPPLNFELLSKILKEKYNYEIDEKRLNDFDELKDLRAVLKFSKRPKLFLNPRLSSSQKLFILGKEIAYNYLNISKRSFIHSSLKLNTFDHLLNNYNASYFSTALIINKKYFINDVNKFFENEVFTESLLINLVNRYNATPEMLFQRLANLAEKVWGLNQYFFLRFNSFAGTEKFDLTKEVRLNIRQNPGGYQINEHYCRRWLSIELLQKLKDEIIKTDQPGKMKAGILHSKFHETDDEYLTFSIAQQNILNPGTFTSVTIGFYLNDQLKRTIKFWNYESIPFRIVNNTCETCSISNCSQRVAEPTTLWTIQRSQNIEKAIQKLT